MPTILSVTNVIFIKCTKGWSETNNSFHMGFNRKHKVLESRSSKVFRLLTRIELELEEMGVKCLNTLKTWSFVSKYENHESYHSLASTLQYT